MAGGTRLELEERERLAALKAEGLSLRAIARALGRAASTISRELRRNALPKGGYLPAHAEGCYRGRRQRPAVLERDERRGPAAGGGGSARRSWSATSGSAGSGASACRKAGRRSRSPAGSSAARCAG